jgi:asparagine synthase (glutamine-hydrolysing)
MLDRLRLRGPDGEGISQEGSLCLGHRRLAILDLSIAARQPMLSAGGRYVISFNGEIYNFRELIADLGVSPDSLRTTSDTEILLLAWERWGSDCLPRLAGQWAFALYDRLEERLWLVRDRFGEKPLYHHTQNGLLSFCSTIQGLLAAPWVPREISPEALEECLALRYVVSPRTVVRDVSKIPPGHLLRADRFGLEIRSWWSPHFGHESRPAGPPVRKEEVVEEFGRLLERATRRCLVSDRPVALLLSNGIDSGALATILAETDPSFRAFTYRVSDTAQAAVSNGRLGPGGPLRSEAIDTTYDEMARSVVPVLSKLNEPVGDGSALATWLLIHNARPQATVFLCGQGADEILGGYRLSQDRFRLAMLRRICRLPIPMLDRAMPHFVNGEEPSSIRRLALIQASAPCAPAAARFLIHRPLPASALQDMLGRAMAPGRYLESIKRLYQECPPGASDLDRIQEVMLRTFLSENLLSHGDSVAMASSAELRMPYLDRDLVEFVLGLPDEMRVGRWPGRINTKLILRWWARNRLPSHVRRRPKRAFRSGSIRTLLKSPASDLLSLILDSRPLRRHLPGLSAWLKEPPGLPRGTWGATTWTLASLAAWFHAMGMG